MSTDNQSAQSALTTAIEVLQNAGTTERDFAHVRILNAITYIETARAALAQAPAPSGEALSMLRDYCATRAARRFHGSPHLDHLICMENEMVLEWVDDGIEVVRAALAAAPKGASK